MNLKEAFHYQNFLNSLMNLAAMSVKSGGALKITKKHLKNKANPDAENVEETIEPTDYIPVESYVRFMECLIEAKAALTEAISDAKSGLAFDIDAAVETNKLRQSAHGSLKRILNMNKAYTKTERDSDYKFNAEGNQVSYVYDVEVTATEMFDRKFIKDKTKELITKSDEVSAMIDMAMVNTIVNYTPAFDVNDSFEDIIAEFVVEENDEE